MWRLLSIAIALVATALPGAATARQLEHGRATISIQHETIRTMQGDATTTQNETDLLIDLSQDTVDYGTITLQTGAARIDSHWQATNYTLGVEDFWFSTRTRGDLSLGDAGILHRSNSAFFLNYQIPMVFFRGMLTDLTGDGWDAHFFGGRLTQRAGIMGNAYDFADEYLYGFRFGVDLPHESFLGGGYLGTQFGQDALQNPPTSSNNIFLADVRVGIVDDFNLTAEYLQSLYHNTANGWTSDFSVIAGPIYETDNVSLQANYRNMRRDFRFVSSIYQTTTNQEGAFAYANLNFKDEHKINAYGSADFSWDDPTAAYNRRRLYTLSTNAGVTYYPTEDWYLLLNAGAVKKNASGPSSVDDLRYDATLGASGEFLQRRLNPYARFRYRETRTGRPIPNIEREPDGILGLRWDKSRQLQMELQSEFRHISDTLGTRDSLISSVTSLLNWRPISRVYVSPAVEYTNTRNSIAGINWNGISLSLGYGQELHHGWKITTNVRWSKEWGPFTNSFLDILGSLQKTFLWGRPLLRTGVPKEGEPIICGGIEGYLFVDENGDRIRQAWEKGIPDIPVYLDERFAAVTDADGKFVFDNVLVGRRALALEARAIPLEYMPQSFRQTVEVKLRKTAEIFFPALLQEGQGPQG